MKALALLFFLSGCAVAWGDHSCASINFNSEPAIHIDKDRK
jgi:hypothetical protein